MDNAVLQIRISKKLKKDSMVVASNLGFTTSTLIKLFLAHVVSTRKIPFEIEEIPNAKTAKSLRDSKSEPVYHFDNSVESIAFLKKIIQSTQHVNSELPEKIYKRSHKSAKKDSGADAFAT